MDHVLGLVQTDAWEPFERGIGDVVGIPDPNHRGIGIESRENGVCDLHKVLLYMKPSAIGRGSCKQSDDDQTYSMRHY